MSETVSLATRLEPCDDVIFRDLEGESVLLDLKTGLYFGLNPVGTRIWHLMEEGRTPAQILETLLAEYEVPPEQCRRDLEQLLGALQQKSLVQVAKSASR